MSDPSGAASVGAAFFGVKLITAVAGFAGGVVSLSFIRELTRWQMLGAVLSGTLTAAYFTPVVVIYAPKPISEPLELAIAYTLGLCAMNVVPALIKLTAVLRDDPLGFFKRWRNGGE